MQNLTAKPVRYPELKRLLDERLEEWKRSNGRSERPSVRDLADAVQKATGEIITHSSLYDWIYGHAKPHAKKIQALAKFFAPADSTVQEQIREQFEQATKKAEAVLDPLDSVELLERPLQVGFIPFEHFCQLEKQEPNGFLDKLVANFLAFAGLGQVEFSVVKPKDAEDQLCAGKLDMVLGMFVEPSRTRHLWFYHQLPILIPLNAVHAKPLNQNRESLLRQMTTLGNSTQVKKSVFPIIDPIELGGLYVEHYLGIEDKNNEGVYHKLPAYKIEDYAKKLVENSSFDRTPLCVTDEVSCCLVWLKTKELVGNKKVKNIGLVATGENKKDHRFPRYRYGIALAKRHTRWIRHFEESFELFLESNTELVARLYRKLHDDLLKHFAGKLDSNELCKKRIEKWLTYGVSAEERVCISPTWESIINLSKGFDEE